MYQFHGLLLNENSKFPIIEKFKAIFVDEDFPERILLSNHLKHKDKVLPLKTLRTLEVPNPDNVYLYHERLGEMYETDLDSVYSYLEQLEPWEDVDLILFDNSFTWYICVTHNDSVILYGFDEKD
jgi:hypothetical protein